VPANNSVEKPANTNVVEFPEFEGAIAFGTDSVAVSGSIKVNQRGVVQYALSPIPVGSESAWLLRVIYPNQRVMPRLQLRTTTSGGVRLTSDYLYIYSGGSSSDSEGARFNISGDLLAQEADYRDVPATSRGVRLFYFPAG
jgi:hypothetical protein